MNLASKGKIEVYLVSIAVLAAVSSLLIDENGYEEKWIWYFIAYQIIIDLFVILKSRIFKWIYLLTYYSLGLYFLWEFLWVSHNLTTVLVALACFFAAIFIQFSPNVIIYLNQAPGEPEESFLKRED